MNKVVKGLAFLVLAAPLLCSTAFAQETAAVTIEDEGFVELPALIDGAVKNSKTYRNDYSECGLQSKSIDLGADVQGYFVTTKSACGWGASQGPFWVVVQKGETASTVLFDSGYLINVLAEKHNGLSDLDTTNATAAESSMAKWVYDGKEYKFLKSTKEEMIAK